MTGRVITVIADSSRNARAHGTPNRAQDSAAVQCLNTNSSVHMTTLTGPLLSPSKLQPLHASLNVFQLPLLPSLPFLPFLPNFKPSKLQMSPISKPPKLQTQQTLTRTQSHGPTHIVPLSPPFHNAHTIPSTSDLFTGGSGSRGEG